MAISNFVLRCLNDEPPIIYGDGKQTRDFTYIDDVVDAYLALLDTDAADGKTMNISSSDKISIRELAEYVVEETGAGVETVHEECKDTDARHTHADVSKANDLIEYEVSINIRQGVSKFIDGTERTGTGKNRSFEINWALETSHEYTRTRCGQARQIGT